MSYEKKQCPIRWGILATGWIAEKFTRDLLVDPKTRDVADISHTVVAAASSSSADRAADFLKSTGCPSSAKAYGSYKELVADPNVDIIYVATPHSHHYQNVLLCLHANKHVLCEKAFTVNAEQARLLYAEANKRNLFLMEAVWTRFFPMARELRDFVAGGGIGKVHRVFADLAFPDTEKDYPDSHRMVNPALAGGTLLDIGIYSLTWVFQFLYHIAPEDVQKEVPKVAAAMTPWPSTGADERTSMVLQFAGGAHGVATSSLRVGHDPDKHGSAGAPIRIQGEKGEVQVMGPAFRPTTYRVVMQGDSKNAREVERPIPGGHGMFWEADECARLLMQGKTESLTMTQRESVVIMEVMDAVRKQGGLKYPDRIESTEYPLAGF